MPLDEIHNISTWAHAQDTPLHMHLDGAQLWETVVAGAGSLQEFTSCFDSVSLWFTKGLGAPIGSIIVGNAKFIQRARMIRKLLGGGLRQLGVIAGPAEVAIEQVFLGGQLATAHRYARRLAKSWEDFGGKLQNPTETHMVWLDLEPAGVAGDTFADLAKCHGVLTMRRRLQRRLVLHYQICQDALQSIERLFYFVLNGRKCSTSVSS